MRQLRIESIELKNVGPFQNFRLELPPIKRDDIAEVHMLTGPNGSGKSTILHAIAGALSASATEELKKRLHGGHAKLRINGFEVGVDDYIASGLLPKPALTNIEILPPDKTVASLSDRLAGRLSSPPVGAFFYSGSRQLDVAIASPGKKIKSANALQGALDQARSIDAQALLNWIADSKVRAALAHVELAEREAGAYEANLRVVAQIISEIIDRAVTFDLERINFQVRLVDSENKVPLDVLPDGLKSLIAWLGDLMRRLELVALNQEASTVPFILLLDEIDIHLHPRWQWRVLPAIQRAFPKAQIILTTHSPFVIGSVKDAWVYRLDPQQTTCGPIHSGAGESIATILEDVLDVSEIFDPETHLLFKGFYSERQRVLEGAGTELIEKLAVQLSARGEEVQDIVSRELAQLKRLTGKKIGHAQV